MQSWRSKAPSWNQTHACKYKILKRVVYTFDEGSASPRSKLGGRVVGDLDTIEEEVMEEEDDGDIASPPRAGGASVGGVFFLKPKSMSRRRW